jgi:hypothetical protein
LGIRRSTLVVLHTDSSKGWPSWPLSRVPLHTAGQAIRCHQRSSAASPIPAFLALPPWSPGPCPACQCLSPELNPNLAASRLDWSAAAYVITTHTEVRGGGLPSSRGATCWQLPPSDHPATQPCTSHRRPIGARSLPPPTPICTLHTPPSPRAPIPLMPSLHSPSCTFQQYGPLRPGPSTAIFFSDHAAARGRDQTATLLHQAPLAPYANRPTVGAALAAASTRRTAGIAPTHTPHLRSLFSPHASCLLICS